MRRGDGSLGVRPSRPRSCTGWMEGLERLIRGTSHVSPAAVAFKASAASSNARAPEGQEGIFIPAPARLPGDGASSKVEFP